MLLAQPTALRQRLLRSAGGAATRVAYVMGPSSRLYEERGVGDALPKLAVATEVPSALSGSCAKHVIVRLFLCPVAIRLEFSITYIFSPSLCSSALRSDSGQRCARPRTI